MLWTQAILSLSPHSISERKNRELLLQFLLSELLGAYKAYQSGCQWKDLLSTQPCFFPYDWTTRTGFLNKAYEQSRLLTTTFPDYIELAINFEKKLFDILIVWQKESDVPQKTFIPFLQDIYSLIEPLIEVCKEDENLLFFLLKNRETIDSLMKEGHLCQFLHQIHPFGLETLGEKMCDQYHQRGFFSQISEFKLLLTELTHA